MSDTLADLATWHSPEFLSGNMDHKPLILNNHHRHHIPYDFASSSSTESESDDDDIAGLTRRFTRSVSLQERLKIPYPVEGFSCSPESTFNRNIPVRSSPTTPFLQPDGDSRDLIYVARMKMSVVNDGVYANGRLLEPSLSHHHHHLLPNCAIWSGNDEFIRQQQFRRRVSGDCGGRCETGGPVRYRQSAWPLLPVENNRRQPPPNGGISGGFGRGIVAVKKQRAGTGVFLPRNYCNGPPESKKKPACSPTHLPAGITQSFNKNINSIAPPQPSIHGVFAPQYQFPPPPHHFKRDELSELVTARRTALMLAQQRQSPARVLETRIGQTEVVLPQEWTY